MSGIITALGWVILYWVCFVMLATVALGLVACVGMMLLGDDVTYSEPEGDNYDEGRAD